MKKKEDYIGKVVGPYKIEEFIGAGAYSWVYKAQHTRSESLAAVKIFHCFLYKDVDELINRETISMTKLKDHPHAVHFLECSRVDDEHPFIVMDLKDGNLRTKRLLRPLDVVVWIRQIASALHSAHEKGVIHLDVKPENILIDSKGENAFISDFGISRKLNVKTGRVDYNTTNGSYYYISPECTKDKPCVASDQYSLAITAYELLCGRKPFNGNTIEELERQHREDLPPSVCKYRRNLPAGINDVLQKALAKKPGDRYEDIQVFAKALDEAVSKAFYPVVTTTNTLTNIAVANTTDTAEKSAVNNRRAAIVRVALFSAVLLTAFGITEEYIVSSQSKTNVLASRMPTKSTPLSLRPTASVSTPPALGFGSLIHTYTGHTETVTIAMPSPGQQFVASGTISGEVDVWKISDNSHAQSVHKQQKAIQDITWLDNRSIVSTSDTHILAWDAFTGQVLPKWPLYPNKEGYDLNTRWSPDSQTHVALYMGSKVSIFDNPLHCHGWNNPDKPYVEHTDAVTSVAWSPDGTLLASASEDTTVQVWIVEAGQRILTYLGHQCPVVSVAWSPDGRYLASAGNDGVIHVYRALPNPSLVDMYYHSAHKEQSVSITALAWSLDSRFLASSGDDNRVRVWQLQTHQPQDYAGHKEAVSYISWLYLQQRQCIMSCSADKTIQIWRATQPL